MRLPHPSVSVGAIPDQLAKLNMLLRFKGLAAFQTAFNIGAELNAHPKQCLLGGVPSEMHGEWAQKQQEKR
jgi:hypothetical protein